MPTTHRPTTRYQALTPGMPARFERFRFMSADAGSDGTSGTGTTPEASPGDPGDRPLGPNGEKALQAERDARKALEQTVAQMQQAQKDQAKAFAEALGIKPDSKDDGTKLLTTLQSEVAEMRRETTVLRLAAANGITDTKDIELLKSAKDEDAMSALAGRLAAKADEGPGTPKPDLTQGGQGTQVKPEVAPGLPRLQAAYASSSTQ